MCNDITLLKVRQLRARITLRLAADALLKTWSQKTKRKALHSATVRDMTRRFLYWRGPRGTRLPAGGVRVGTSPKDGAACS